MGTWAAQLLQLHVAKQNFVARTRRDCCTQCTAFWIAKIGGKVKKKKSYTHSFRQEWEHALHSCCNCMWRSKILSHQGIVVHSALRSELPNWRKSQKKILYTRIIRTLMFYILQNIHLECQNLCTECTGSFRINTTKKILKNRRMNGSTLVR